jgi:DNA-binding response OmpR family regulator
MVNGPAAVTRILIADGDASIRAAYTDSLRQDSRDIIEAADGRDALVKALVRVPSLVVTELDLPYIDGFTLCEILRRDRMTTEVPIVVVTSRSDANDIKQARRAGADVVLAKSSPVATVTWEVGRLLKDGRALRMRSASVLARAAQQKDRSAQLLAAAVEQRSARARHQPIVTSNPPLPPPALSCAKCERQLIYEQSYIGGVNAHQIEQWDYFTCPNACGRFQYRHRTRKLRQVS